MCVTDSNRDTIQKQYEDSGYRATANHTNVDGSGWFDFQLIIPVTSDKTDIIANGIDKVTFSNIPIDTIVTIDDEDIAEVTDGSLELTIDTPGEYHVWFTNTNYLSVRIIINAS